MNAPRGGPPGGTTWAQQLHGLYLESPEQRRVRRRRQFRRRRAAAAVVVITVVVGGVYLAQAATSPSPRALPAGSPRAAGATKHGPPTAPTSRPPPPSSEPGGGRTLLPNDRIVAFYGAAGVPRLGVLGDAPPGQLWPRLVAQAGAYQQPSMPVVPAYELIAFVTQAAPGRDGTYSSRADDNTIATYLATVRAHHGLLILDIQPGRTDFLADAQSLTSWLIQPDVGLALDPEWQLTAAEVPDRQIGQTTAAEVNAVSAWLAQVVAANNLPQKLLLIHQFTADMVADKASVQPRPGVATVFNMDGFGSQPNKLARYRALAADPRFALGFKVFYHQDSVPYPPADILALTPPPSVIEYQ